MPVVKFHELAAVIFDNRAAMDEDDANEVLLNSSSQGSNVRMAVASEVASDDISWLDEPALDVAGVSRDQFDVEDDIDLQEPVLREMLSDRPFITKVRRGAARAPPTLAIEDEEPVGKGPVKWEIRF